MKNIVISLLLLLLLVLYTVAWNSQSLVDHFVLPALCPVVPPICLTPTGLSQLLSVH